MGSRSLCVSGSAIALRPSGAQIDDRCAFQACVCVCLLLSFVCELALCNLRDRGHEAGGDNLSMFSFGNIHRGSPLYWLHAFGVWGVVLTIVKLVWQAQERFIHMRWVWLRGMPDIRANTVLVEGIPPEYQSAKKLREFFEVLFPGDKVKDTYCVRDTSVLRETLYALDEAKKVARLVTAHSTLPPGSRLQRSRCGLASRAGTSAIANSDPIPSLEP